MIRIQKADKYYNKGKQNELHVLNGISLELPDSGMIAIFGRSGCGKTTLLNTIGGLDSLSSGEVFIGQENIKRSPDVIRNRDIGYIFQNYNLNKEETVFENVADALRLCGMTDEAAIEERVLAALRNVDMERYQKRTPDTLSGGQQQRVAIARAIVKNPAILLADEPTGNLDEANTVMIMDLLKAISRDHLVLLVTHEANLVDYYCDKVIELLDGSVKGIRENADAQGYDARDKNHIYLGELPCTTGKLPGVSVAYYGEPVGEIHLKVVSVGGKLYLQSDTPSLRILDSTSEVKLKEGEFSGARAGDTKSSSKKELDMSHLAPFEGKRFGRLFDFKNSMKLAWRGNFSQKQKRSTRLLRFCLVLMAVVLVFMSARSAVILRDYRDLKRSSSEEVFWLPLENRPDLTALYDSLGQNGIDELRLSSAWSKDGEIELNFRLGEFMTANAAPLSVSGTLWSAAMAEEMPLLAGTRELSESTEILISSASADRMIAESSYGFIDGYEALIGLISEYNLSGIGLVRIAGVVQSEEACFFASPLAVADYIMQTQSGLGGFAVLPLSRAGQYYTGTIVSGEAVYYAYWGDAGETPKPGDSFLLSGDRFRVSEIISGEYESYVQVNHKETLESLEDYSARVIASGKAVDKIQAAYQWFWEYYYRFYSEYRADRINGEILAYIDAFHFEPAVRCELLGNEIREKMPIGPEDLWAAYCWQKESGRYPTQDDEDYAVFRDGLLASDESAYYTAINNAIAFYDLEFNNYYENSWDFKNGQDMIILNDEDYIGFAYRIGKTDSPLVVTEPYYEGLAMLIHADDPEKAAAFLKPLYEDLWTPEAIFEEALGNSLKDVVSSIISIFVVLGLMCLCVFILMRTSLMRRVREVGIFRAIGVSKRNLIFRFFIEALLLSALTIVIGYLAASIVAMWFSSLPLISMIFYFPFWLAFLLLVLLLAATLTAGILPLCLLLHKTPSAILAKYDI